MRSNNVIAFCVLVAVFMMRAAGAQAQSVSVSGVVPGVCGNAIIEPGEQCDGTNLNGLSCTNLGYATGTLGCTSLCTLDATQCISAGTSSSSDTSGSGGGGGAGSLALNTPPLQKSVTLAGQAYPMATVVISEAGSIKATVAADANAVFQATLQVVPGIHAFTLYAVDRNGRRSLPYTLTATVSTNTTTAISGILLPSAIDLGQPPVKQGDLVRKISGDLANNGKVDIADLSILLYWWHTTTPQGIAVADLNRDGKVNLIDLSIMLFNWNK